MYSSPFVENVIKLGNYLRDQNKISLKTPCRELVMINAIYPSDVKRFETYIKEKLNVRTVTLTLDEEKYSVNYKLLPLYNELKVKYGKDDASKVSMALQNVSKTDIKEFVENGELEVLGFNLSNQDMKVVRTFDNPNPNMYAHFNNDVFIVLDTSPE
jgi:isoleucyl-tRNA synthetase